MAYSPRKEGRQCHGEHRLLVRPCPGCVKVWSGAACISAKPSTSRRTGKPLGPVASRSGSRRSSVSLRLPPSSPLTPTACRTRPPGVGSISSRSCVPRGLPGVSTSPVRWSHSPISLRGGARQEPPLTAPDPTGLETSRCTARGSSPSSRHGRTTLCPGTRTTGPPRDRLSSRLPAGAPSHPGGVKNAETVRSGDRKNFIRRE